MLAKSRTPFCPLTAALAIVVSRVSKQAIALHSNGELMRPKVLAKVEDFFRD